MFHPGQPSHYKFYSFSKLNVKANRCDNMFGLEVFAKNVRKQTFWSSCLNFTCS